MDALRSVPARVAVKRSSRAEEIKLIISDIYAALVNAAEFVVYVVAYALSAVYRALKSEKLPYVLKGYKSVMISVSASLILFAIFGIFGGMEAGFISFGVGMPVFTGLALLFRFLCADK